MEVDGEIRTPKPCQTRILCLRATLKATRDDLAALGADQKMQEIIKRIDDELATPETELLKLCQQTQTPSNGNNKPLAVQEYHLL
jgi:hypothetical protein